MTNRTAYPASWPSPSGRPRAEAPFPGRLTRRAGGGYEIAITPVGCSARALRRGLRRVLNLAQDLQVTLRLGGEVVEDGVWLMVGDRVEASVAAAFDDLRDVA